MNPTYKLVVLLAVAAMTMAALAWVNQQNVRDIGSGRPAADSMEY